MANTPWYDFFLKEETTLKELLNEKDKLQHRTCMTRCEERIKNLRAAAKTGGVSEQVILVKEQEITTDEVKKCTLFVLEELGTRMAIEQPSSIKNDTGEVLKDPLTGKPETGFSMLRKVLDIPKLANKTILTFLSKELDVDMAVLKKIVNKTDVKNKLHSQVIKLCNRTSHNTLVSMELLDTGTVLLTLLPDEHVMEEHNNVYQHLRKQVTRFEHTDRPVFDTETITFELKNGKPK